MQLLNKGDSVIKDYREATREDRFYNALLTVLQLTARIAAGRSGITLKGPDVSNRPPAWTEMDTFRVSLNRHYLHRFGKDERHRAVRTAKGLLYHELAHVLFSPIGLNETSATSFVLSLRDRIKAMKPSSYSDGLIMNAFNCMEDKRIENLFVRRFRNARGYFALPIFEFLVKDTGTYALAYANIAGRPWLDHDVVTEIREKAGAEALTFKSNATSWTDDIDAVVRQFIRLSARDMVDNLDNTARLLIQWMELIDLAAEAGGTGTGTTQGSCGSCADGETRGESSATIPERYKTPVLEDKDQSDDKLDDKDLEKLNDMGTPSEEEGADDDGDGEGETGDGEASGGDESGEGDPSDGDSDDSESDDDAEPSDGGSGAGGPGEQEVRSLIDAIAAATERATGAVWEDVEEITKAVLRQMDKENSATPSSKGPFWPSLSVPVTSEMQQAARQITRKLEEIRIAASPDWLKGETAGRLNTARDLLYDGDRDDVFDLYDEGVEDEMKAHINLCVDMSGSMSVLSDQAAQTLWTLEEAFDRVDHAVDIYGFGSQYQRLDEPHKRNTYYRRYVNGGTAPFQMLKDVVQRSTGMRDVADRLIVCITDGVWHAADYESLMGEWTDLGGMSMFFLLGREEEITGLMSRGVVHPKRPYGFDTWAAISEPKDAIAPVKAFVQHLMQAHLKRVG